MSRDIGHIVLRSLGAEPFINRDDLTAIGNFDNDAHVTPANPKQKVWCALPQEVTIPYFVDTKLIPQSPVIVLVQDVALYYNRFNGREGIVVNDAARVSYFHLHNGKWIHFRETRPTRRSYNLYEGDIHCVEPELNRLFETRFPHNPLLEVSNNIKEARQAYVRSCQHKLSGSAH